MLYDRSVVAHLNIKELTTLNFAFPFHKAASFLYSASEN